MYIYITRDHYPNVNNVISFVSMSILKIQKQQNAMKIVTNYPF